MEGSPRGKSPFKGDLEGRLKGERGGLHLGGLPLPILRLAVPSILANITVPLVGMVDIAIAGHIADASAMGGIAMGAMLFSLLYWNFGFLRVGTGGLTAQAYGRGDTADRAALLTQNRESVGTIDKSNIKDGMPSFSLISRRTFATSDVFPYRLGANMTILHEPAVKRIRKVSTISARS